MERKIGPMNFQFEQIPIDLAKRAAGQNLKPASMHFISCVVCGKAVELERCKTDEKGKAVHETCYLNKTAASLTKHRGRA